MYGKAILPLLLGASLFWIAACGPEPAAPPPEQPPVQVEAPPTEAAEPATPAESASVSPEGSVVVTGVQPVDLADAGAEEGCILPGLVITGQNVDAVPCDTASEPAPEAKEEETMPQEPVPAEPAQPQAQDEYAAEMTALAVEDLSQRLGIPADQIEVREVRAVTWPDASLGCPQPDMMYAQVLTEGLLIRLSAGGEMYSYHSGGNQPPFLCEETLKLTPPKGDEFVPPPGFKLDTPDSESD